MLFIKNGNEQNAITLYKGENTVALLPVFFLRIMIILRCFSDKIDVNLV